MCYKDVPELIFQSTLPRGERPRTNRFRFLRIYFNPRSHEGSDNKIQIVTRFYGISIHAPTRGATRYSICSVVLWQFQSTLPRGERPDDYIIDHDYTDFNPRSHEGSDADVAFTETAVNDFNPRSHEGSDRMHRLYEYWMDYFNPRSHEGSDRQMDTHECRWYDFNPRSHEGSDERYTCPHTRAQDFNPRSHEGSDY